MQNDIRRESVPGVSETSIAIQRNGKQFKFDAYCAISTLLTQVSKRLILALVYTTKFRQLLGTFPPEECANYFENAGYTLT
jgi:hypothetical protein